MAKLILNLVPLVLIFTIYSGVFVLSSRIVVKKALSWKLCLGYTLIALLVSAGARFLTSAIWWPLPPLLNVLVGISLNLMLGTYIFGTYGKDSIDNALGFRRGLKITALGIVFVFAFAAIIMSALYFLSPAMFQKT